MYHRYVLLKPRMCGMQDCKGSIAMLEGFRSHKLFLLRDSGAEALLLLSALGKALGRINRIS